MKRVFKRIGFVLFWEMIVLLILLLLKPEYYIPWLIFSLVTLFFLIYLSFRVVPSRKEEKRWRAVARKYHAKYEELREIRLKARLLPFSCADCEYTSNFLEFLEEGKCPKCDSRRWTTLIPEKGEQYLEIFRKYEEIQNFIQSFSYREKNKLEKIRLMEAEK
jgi:predicted Zn-ribbon and HTH transcriptional regulator